jgi:hypothetical protein
MSRATGSLKSARQVTAAGTVPIRPQTEPPPPHARSQGICRPRTRHALHAVVAERHHGVSSTARRGLPIVARSPVARWSTDASRMAAAASAAWPAVSTAQASHRGARRAAPRRVAARARSRDAG